MREDNRAIVRAGKRGIEGGRLSARASRRSARTGGSRWQWRRDPASPRPACLARPQGRPERERTKGGFLTGLTGRENGSRPPVTEYPHDNTAPVCSVPSPQTSTALAVAKLRILPQSAHPFPDQCRKTPPSAAEDAELKASIRAAGLKQNLVVHPAAGEEGVHAVTAGGRRLKALQELAAEGVIPADFKVPCLVEGRRRDRDLADGKHASAPRCTRRTSSSPWRR